MDEFKTEIVVNLNKPIAYKPKGSGEIKDCETITIEAPSNKVASQMSKLEQGYSRAENEQSEGMAEKLFNSGLMQDKNFVEAMREAEQADKDKNKDLSDAEKAKAAIDLIKQSKTVNFDEYMLVFKDILTRTAVLDDGETKLTDPLYQLIDYRDSQRMLGDYLVNFTNIS